MNCRHAPVRDGLPLDRVSEFDFTGRIVQEKLDGWRAFLDGDSGELIGRNHRFGFYRQTFPGWFFDGELMPNGEFIAFDVLRHPQLGDISLRPTVERLTLLDTAPCLSTIWYQSPSGIRDFVRWVKESNVMEGVVAKLADKPYSHHGALRFKREFTADFIVVSADPVRNSCEVATSVNSVGRISGGGHCLPGQMVEVKAMQFTAAGKLRHGRFGRVRTDK